MSKEEKKKFSIQTQFGVHIVNTLWVNKVVVDSSPGDAPKYMGEGVALCDPLVSLAGQNEQILVFFQGF